MVTWMAWLCVRIRKMVILSVACHPHNQEQLGTTRSKDATNGAPGLTRSKKLETRLQISEHELHLDVQDVKGQSLLQSPINLGKPRHRLLPISRHLLGPCCCFLERLDHTTPKAQRVHVALRERPDYVVHSFFWICQVQRAQFFRLFLGQLLSLLLKLYSF